jgi:CHAD domain-containing protein
MISLDPVKSSREHSRNVLTGRIKVFLKELRALASGTTDEGVHQTRIESRRMRIALEAFRETFPERSFDSVYREVRHVTRILGTPRENAVTLGLVRELAGRRPDEDLCLKYLEKRLAGKLKKQKRQLRKKFGRIDLPRFKAHLEDLMSAMVADQDSAASPPEENSSSKPASNKTKQARQKTLFKMGADPLEQAARLIARLTAPIREFPTARRFDQAPDEELHSLRIAAKKTRYAMELNSSIWPGGLSDHIEKAHKLQQTGGKYNDWCALCCHLENELKRLDSPDSLVLAFQMGKVTAFAETEKEQLKARMREALVEFQNSLVGLAILKDLHMKGGRGALSRAKQKSRSKAARNAVNDGEDAA